MSSKRVTAALVVGAGDLHFAGEFVNGFCMRMGSTREAL